MFRWFLIIAFVIFSSAPPKKCCCVIRGINSDSNAVSTNASIEAFLKSRVAAESSTGSVGKAVNVKSCCQKKSQKARQVSTKQLGPSPDGSSDCPHESCNDLSCQLHSSLQSDCGCDQENIEFFQDVNSTTTPINEGNTELLLDGWMDSSELIRGMVNPKSASDINLSAISRSGFPTACDLLCRWLC